MSDGVFTSLVPDDLTDGEDFVARLMRIYGQQTANDILSRLGQPDRAVAFWRNPLISGDVALPSGQPVPGLPALSYATDRVSVTHSPAAERGALYIQNPSSYFAVQVLAPQPGEEILDLAAAPGGKTIAIAACMQNQGRLAAVEPVAGRFHRLKANTERCGVSVCAFYQRDGRGVGRAVPERFDRVLLDAPCSTEARMRWFDPDSYRHWQLRKVKETSRKQKSLLRSAYLALKPGGVLVYCTCSFAEEENEQVVAHLLKRTDAYLEPIQGGPEHVLPGRVDAPSARGKGLPEQIAHSRRIIPDWIWDGFYLARIRKPSA